MSLLLTKDERLRFAEWLEHEAASGLGIIEQMKKSGMNKMMVEAFIAKEEPEVFAAQVIARKLRSIEDA